jgi:malate permease and related proteins
VPQYISDRISCSDVTGPVQLLLEIFANDLLPVFAIAGAGFLLARFAGVQVHGVSRLTFHVLAPALVFNVLVTSTLDAAQSSRMALFYLLVAISAAVMARLAAIPLRLDRRMLSAFMLVVVCSNAGNYGLPVALLAFGREALAFASVYFICSAIFSYTGGVLLAASGRRSVRDAVAGLFRVPAFYGAMAALLTMSLDLAIPAFVMRPVGMLSDSALPLMILVLGMQIERATMPERPVVVAAAVAVSLVLTPLAAIGWAHVVGLRGAAFQAGVLQSSMPTAVMTTILALEFDALPQFVTSVVCIATLLSPLTVTLLIAYLQGV